MENIKRMKREIDELQKSIHDYIDKHWLCCAVELLKNYLGTSENDNGKLAYFLQNTKISKLIENCSEKHDILCCIAKALGMENIPTENIYSKQPSIEFDPSKNGKNILKHDISFLDIASYTNDKASVISYTKTKNGEERKVHFLQIHDNKNVLLVFSTNKLNEEILDRIDKQIGETSEEHLKENLNFAPNRLISARYFDNSKIKIEKTIKETIRDEGLDEQAINVLRRSVCDFLIKYGYAE